jgi:Lrp/AsnC family transcriptional regulator, regulator for asnA, asnC and gidA
MDKLDYLILGELLKDAQTPFSTIAKKVGTSPYTVAKRYERMTQEGTITASMVSIDLSKLGYQGKAFLMVTNTPNEEKQCIVEALKKIRNVISISEVIGTFNILAVVMVTDLNSIKAIVKEAKKIPGVEHLEVSFIDDTSFPVKASFNEVMSKKCIQIANLKTEQKTGKKPASR